MPVVANPIIFIPYINTSSCHDCKPLSATGTYWTCWAIIILVILIAVASDMPKIEISLWNVLTTLTQLAIVAGLLFMWSP